VSFLRRAGGQEIVTIASLSNRKLKVAVDLSGPFGPLLSDGATGATLSGKMMFNLDPCGYFVGKK
jgi:hypothetical protein